MKTRKIELGDVFYVFSNWGLVKGHVVKIESCLVKDGYFYDIEKGDKIPADEDNNADVATIIPDDTKDKFELRQYKLNIDLDEDNRNFKYGFFYVEEQLFDSPQDAINSMLNIWGNSIKFEYETNEYQYKE